MTRPYRQRKEDRMLHPGASGIDIRHDIACAPFDRAARQADADWGTDRLVSLVSPEMAERFGRAMAILNTAMEGDDPAVTAAAVGICVRGLAAMDAEARARGHVPTPPEAWRFDLDGQPCAVIRDGGDWTALQGVLPNVRIYSLTEVANALRHYGGMVAAVKDAFPGATVTAIRPKTKLEDDLSDFIPF